MKKFNFFVSAFIASLLCSSSSYGQKTFFSNEQSKDKEKSDVNYVESQKQSTQVVFDYTAPMPGTITEIKVKVGDIVEPGVTCMVLEAMKISNYLGATHGGRVTQIYVKVGDAVVYGQPLFAVK